MERTTLWARLGNLLGGRNRSKGSGGANPAEGAARAEATADIGGHGGSETAAIQPGAPARAVLSRRESGINRPEETYAVINELMESIRKHLESHEERMERMEHFLDKTNAALEHLPEASRTHSDLLSAIQKLTESAATSATRAEEYLSQIPRIADAQRETMVSIGRQLDLLRESGDREMEALSGFQEAVTKLAEASGASTAALKEMHDDSVARETHLQEAVERQTKRLTLFSALAVSVAAIAIVLGLIALLR